MREGSYSPFSFEAGDRVVDSEGKIFVVELISKSKKDFILFNPYEGNLKHVPMSDYRPYTKSIIKCIINFLKT
jgi:hypothetical protein